ncbi:MAG: VOC family protein [Hyphomonadaceae bacterium]|nr:VOC family protein [Hyphomonadaceae bacterium]
MSKVSAFLWFDKEAEEAANLYVSIFRNAKLGAVTRYGAEGPGPAGGVMTAQLEIDGYKFTLLNGGPLFKFNESVSFVIECADQDEVDLYWSRLSEGGAPGNCGWIKDKFGLSWQITPKRFYELANDPDRAKAGRVFGAMLKMTKMDIAALERAAMAA